MEVTVDLKNAFIEFKFPRRRHKSYANSKEILASDPDLISKSSLLLLEPQR